MNNSRNSGLTASGGSPPAVCRKWSTGTDEADQNKKRRKIHETDKEKRKGIS